MEASLRPWYTTGIALVGASAIALAPITPVAPAWKAVDVPAATVAAVSREFQLTALDIPYILTLPIVRQLIVNDVQDIVVFFGGFAKSGVGLAQSLLAIPGVTVEAIQQVLALDFVGAFDTVTAAIRDSVIAVGQPLLDSLIWRGQKADLVQAALRAATPQALIDIANGFLVAGNGVATSAITGVQNLVAAILTLNLSNIVNAAVDGTQNFLASLGAGAAAIVSGIESAQLGITTALATTPPPPPTFSDVTDVAGLRTLSVDNTVSLARSSAVAVAVDPVTPTVEEAPAVTTPDPVEATQVVTEAEPASPEASPVATDVKDAAPEADPKAASTAPDATDATDVSPSKDAAGDAATPTKPLKKPVRTKPSRNVPKDTDGTVPKVTAGAPKDAGADTGTAADKGDADSSAKPSSDGDAK